MSLAKIRIAISSLIFILFLLLFSGWEKLSIFLSSYLPPLQIVPAIIHIITKPEVLFIAGLAFLTVLSFIFGRVYCSFLCPLGTLQDIFIVISRRIGLRRKHSFQQPANGLRYSIFILTLFTAIAGIMVLINLLDPFSFFGRTVTHLFQPLTVWIFNASADILKHFGVYAFVKKLHYIPLSVLASTFGFILLLLIMSFRQGRLYCNTICPVGALLGMISRVSFFQLAINRTDCNACGQCESVCKAGCIDMAKAQIDQDRCVSCFNCLDACPQSVISYRPFSGGAGPRDWSPARRGFLIGSAAAAGSMFWLTNSDLYSLIGADRKKNTLPVTPPGSAGLQHFTATCSACHLCVSACPTKVITPAFLEYGIAGLMQPMMNYRESYCDYECNTCGKVCPTGAIKPLLLPEKKFTQIGTSELIKEKCVVYVNDENCGACGEVCPTHTISFVNKNDILYPETDNQYCIGCGACEKACPTTPKSIIVKSNPIHKKAAQFIPLAQEGKPKKETDKDFPF